MTMRGKELRQALTSGKRVYGIALEGFGHPRWPRFFANRGLDFIWVESEHAPNDRETISWATQLYAAYNICPLLRIPEPSATLAAMGVDAGAQGIIAPYVETVEQVRQLKGAVKYRPLKGEALQTALTTGKFPSPETEAYLPMYNEDAVLVIMIESPAGVRNLPELLAVGGVDAVLMGPHDLSISHGIPEQYDHPIFVEAVQKVISICQEHSVGVGIHYIEGSVERAVAWANWGFNLISHRGDTLFIAEGAQREIGQLRDQLGDESAAATSNSILESGHSI
ncbi:MAG: aldolase [Anaerolineae bacterium]|nr:aldolase [Anaerolineae bacterium]